MLISNIDPTPIFHRKNIPHHIHVPGKPHPNGCIATTCGDLNGVLIFKQLTKSLKCTAVDMISKLMIYPEGSVVVVDRLYGGLDLV